MAYNLKNCNRDWSQASAGQPKFPVKLMELMQNQVFCRSPSHPVPSAFGCHEQQLSSLSTHETNRSFDMIQGCTVTLPSQSKPENPSKAPLAPQLFFN